VVDILNTGLVATFVRKHPEAKSAFNGWHRRINQADWKNPAEVTERLRSADLIDGIWIFNVDGNKYRLAASINFNTKQILIKSVMTHSEYDRKSWKK